MILQDKISTMLNFAMRAGKAVYGTETITESRRKLVILVCRTLSENSLKKLVKDNQKTMIIKTKAFDLFDLTHKNGKAIAVIDKNMADEIIKNINENYEVISEGK